MNALTGPDAAPAPAQAVARGFHAGERAMQARAGKDVALAGIGERVIRDYMPEQHRELFAQLPFVVVGGLDAQRQPWAGVLAGPPGFMTTPDARTLHLAARPAAGDVLAAALQPGAPLGLLGIQPHTRRRNRLNGVVAQVDASGFGVRVAESFGNCPKYIHPREARHVEAVVGPPSAPVVASRLNDEDSRLVRGADTLFIATAHPDAGVDATIAYGVDVSHRGGAPGFVTLAEREDGGQVLILPDYVGNFFFNTLGNVLLNPRAGLLFIDFAHGHLLQLAGDAEIVDDDVSLAEHPGALRLLRVHVRAVRRTEHALPLRWIEP